MQIKPDLPVIIQGGMGAGISSWKLARAVSKLGHLGVVSGTGINTIFIRRLQDGDLEGNIRRALKKFPDQEYVSEVLNTYFIQGGRRNDMPYKLGALPSVNPSLNFLRLTTLASFVEVYLAKENHEGLVGINFLEKLQTSNLPGIYGAMLAGVDYILMGAGIPREIPSVIDHFSRNEDASIKPTIAGTTADTEKYRIHFSPKAVFPEILLFEIKPPKFLAIISSSTLATHLAKKTDGTIDGFVVEAPSAGGHNAPPRGAMQFNPKGEPVYGVKDNADISAIKALGLPFWLAGSFGTPEKLKEAQEAGAIGIQVGTAFAFCEESGLSDDLKKSVIEKWGFSQGVPLEPVFTDPAASPTAFPFKVVPLEQTLSESSVYSKRPRLCDLGYLRQIAINKNGELVYRCPSEPIEDYLHKGGQIEETKNRKCLCNGLMSNIGLAQVQNNQYIEPPLITAGDDLINIKQFFKDNKHSYSANDVIEHILATEKM
jgi:nitronate monooxygenase